MAAVTFACNNAPSCGFQRQIEYFFDGLKPPVPTGSATVQRQASTEKPPKNAEKWGLHHGNGSIGKGSVFSPTPSFVEIRLLAELRQDLRARAPAGLEKTRAPRAGLRRLSPPDDHCRGSILSWTRPSAPRGPATPPAAAAILNRSDAIEIGPCPVWEATMIAPYPWRWAVRDLMQTIAVWWIVYWFVSECLRQP